MASAVTKPVPMVSLGKSASTGDVATLQTATAVTAVAETMTGKLIVF